MSTSDVRQYVLLPPRSLSASRSTLAASTAPFFRSLPTSGPVVTPTLAGVSMKILDSIHEDGAKLVEISATELRALREAHPDVQIAPVMYYRLALAPRFLADSGPTATAQRLTRPISTPHVTAVGTRIIVRVVDATSGNGVKGAVVAAFRDFARRMGAGGTTDGRGEVALDFGATAVQIERLYIYPPLAGYWGAFRENLTLSSPSSFPIEPITFGFTDSLRHFHPPSDPGAGNGVTVGVIDTGVGPHPDVQVIGTEGAGADVDNGEGHGTHVAGIIASRGLFPTGFMGMAPGVSLRSYRVFSRPGGLAANFTIAKAIDRAVSDGCDLLNLSLKIDSESNPSGYVIDPVVQYAISDARRAGTLPICAAGNDYRTAVDFPGRDQLCIAVSALGRDGTFPLGSVESADREPPSGTDSSDFIAAFSNIGPEVDLTGPGVGVISTVPGGYGVMSGTSMACPAVTGMAARLLGVNPTILAMPRDATRSAEIARLLFASAASLGFPVEYEGSGILV